MKSSNIFANIASSVNGEVFEDIISKENIQIQRIISSPNSGDTSKWYDQDTDEWVIVLQGSAIITFENKDKTHLNAGDYLNIPAHTKHQVSWTTPDEKTIWIAIHYNT